MAWPVTDCSFFSLSLLFSFTNVTYFLFLSLTHSCSHSHFLSQLTRSLHLSLPLIFPQMAHIFVEFFSSNVTLFSFFSSDVSLSLCHSCLCFSFPFLSLACILSLHFFEYPSENATVGLLAEIPSSCQTLVPMAFFQYKWNCSWKENLFHSEVVISWLTVKGQSATISSISFFNSDWLYFLALRACGP